MLHTATAYCKVHTAVPDYLCPELLHVDTAYEAAIEAKGEDSSKGHI